MMAMTQDDELQTGIAPVPLKYGQLDQRSGRLTFTLLDFNLNSHT